jgi:uncharacterized membrane protein
LREGIDLAQNVDHDHRTHSEVAMTLQRFFFFVLLLAAALQIIYFYPLMPNKMASHFDASGRANSWMPKEGFFVIYVFVLAILSAVFIILPKVLLKAPKSMINLPHKEYWLAAGRRHQTGKMIEHYMGTAGNLTITLLVCVFQMVFMADLEKQNRLPGFMWLLVAAFLFLMVIWSVQFIRAFRLPPGPR